MNLILPNPLPMKNICCFAREGGEFERIYTIGEELGKGTFGEVYRCNISNDGTPVKHTSEYFAVKVNSNY
jgi:hypothetical protein